MSAFDIRALTMDDVADACGYSKPADHRQRVCGECGSVDLMWITECTPSAPRGTGYDVLVCNECDAECGRNWAGW